MWPWCKACVYSSVSRYAYSTVFLDGPSLLYKFFPSRGQHNNTNRARTVGLLKCMLSVFTGHLGCTAMQSSLNISYVCAVRHMCEHGQGRTSRRPSTCGKSSFPRNSSVFQQFSAVRTEGVGEPHWVVCDTASFRWHIGGGYRYTTLTRWPRSKFPQPLLRRITLVML